MTRRSSTPQYTYKQYFRQEEKQVKKRIILVAGATAVIVLIIWFWGVNFINLIGILGGFFSGKSSDVTFQSQDLPLVKPTISPLPPSTNQKSIKIEGTTTASLTVKIYVNGVQQSKTTANSSGSFSFDNVSLREGLNLIKIIVEKDQEKEESTASLVFDKTSPKLTLREPDDGTVISGTSKEVVVSGNAESDSVVQINGTQAILDQKGNFKYILPLKEGKNIVVTVATDEAGNTARIERTVILEKNEKTTSP